MNDDEFRAFAIGYMASSGDRSYSSSTMAKIFNVSRGEIVTAALSLGIPRPRLRRSRYKYRPPRVSHGQPRLMVKVLNGRLSEKQLQTVWVLRFLESSLARPTRLVDVAKWSNATPETARARLAAAKNTTKKSNVSVRKAQDARVALIEELGREPTQLEVASRIGVTRQRVSQIYAAIGLDGRAGQKALSEPRKKRRAEDARKRSEQKARKDQERSLVLDLAKGSPQMSQSELGLLVGLSQSKVSEILRSAGIRRQYRYSPDEDELVLDTSRTLEEIGKLLNRSPSSVSQRRCRLRSGMGKSKWVPSMEEIDEILELYERVGTYTTVARQFGLNPGQVKSVVVANLANQQDDTGCNNDK